MTPAPSAETAKPRSFQIDSLSASALAKAYKGGALTPAQVINEVYDRIEARGDDAVWITLVSREDALAAAAALPEDRGGMPLWGVPYALKDNIDAKGIATTAACPDFSYGPKEDAHLVARLTDAGALLIGKTNMDQFATGLSGARSPYGTPETPLAKGMISGGSSSGSAVAVSAGLVSFAIGTDTAGSGRVPAAFCNIVGVKPSRGMVSNRGIVPACASLDCASIFALTVADGYAVLKELAHYDPRDPWSDRARAALVQGREVDLHRLTLAIPQESQWKLGGSIEYSLAWKAYLTLLKSAGVTLVEVDMSTFFEAGTLLYSGPWLAERYSGIETFMKDSPESMHLVTQEVIGAGGDITGADTFRAMHRLMQLRRDAEHVLGSVAALLTPTAPITFSVEEMDVEPIVHNAELGAFTTFVNLLDMAALALPAALTNSGLPFGVTLHGIGGTDAKLYALGEALESIANVEPGA